MWPLKSIFYFAAFWVACLAALVNPIWGVVNYLMAYQVHPEGTWWGIPLVQLGIRFSFLAAAFTMIGMITGQRKVPRVRPVISLWEVGIVLLIVFAGCNLIWGYGYNRSSAYAFEKLWKMMIFVLILARLATTRMNLRLVIWSLVIGSLYVGYDAYTANASAFWQGRLELIGGSDFSTTSGTGAHMSAMLPIIGVAFLTAVKWRWRLLAILSGGFTINAIILCRTRSAFIGLLCGALVALLAAPRPGRFRLRLLLACGAVAAFALTDGFFWSRMQTLVSSEALASDMATVSRREIWGHSINLIRDNPLGVGPGNFRYVIGEYDPKYYSRSSHNTLIVCFAELGIQGGIVLLLLLGGSLRCLYLSSRLAHETDHPRETRLTAYGLLVALVTYFVAGLGTERFYCESFWWVVVLPLCLYRTVQREVSLSQVVTEEFEEEALAWGLPDPSTATRAIGPA